MRNFFHTGTNLKRFACVAMLLDHIGASCLEAGLGISYIPFLHIGFLPQLASDASLYPLFYLDCFFRTIGRLAMPIFCYFLMEGFLHTKNAKRYLLRLVCFGLLSEPVFDFAFWGQWYYPAQQNIYATLSLGLLGMMLLRTLHARRAKRRTAKEHLFRGALWLGAIGTVLAADWLHTDYGSTGVILILALYLLRYHKPYQDAALVLGTILQFPAPFAILPLSQYTGARGKCAKWEQWAFYAFYPAHLLLLGMITHFIL